MEDKAKYGNKELAVKEEMTINNWAAMKDQAVMLVKSGMLPASINTPEKAIAIAITSKELGIGMMEGFRSINVIQGKPTISPQLMLALANRTEQLENIKVDATDARCVVVIKRKGRDAHKEEFGVKEATALGLMTKDNYNKQRATMFKWRALAANLRVTFPDVMLGFYTPEEMGAEVKVTDTEEMEIISNGVPEVIEPDEMVNTGIRVPKAYWDAPDRQAVIGEGNKAQKTDKGWFIFSPKSKVNEFNQSFEQPQIEADPLITHDEQLEIFRQLKLKNISTLAFKKVLADTFKIEGTNKIKKSQYPKVFEWIVQNEQDAIEDVA